MSDGDLARMLKFITQKLENLEKKSVEIEENKRKTRQKMVYYSIIDFESNYKTEFSKK